LVGSPAVDYRQLYRLAATAQVIRHVRQRNDEATN
jgi:hypothetical protein